MTKSQAVADANITHKGSQPPLNLKTHQDRLKAMKDLTFPLPQSLELLGQLAQFELGRFLLTHGGINGYWTSYVILEGPQKQGLSPLENWVVHKSPVVRATQERFKIFQSEMQKRLRSDMTLLSVPCGLMDDCLTLDFQGMEDVHLIGIDIDPESLDLAQRSAQRKGIPNTSFHQQDAWALKEIESYDLITSNGLSIYEPDNEKIIQLYSHFHKALRPGGTLITSFLTPPPTLSADSSWKNFSIDEVTKQKAVLGEIAQVQWQHFRTESGTRAHLETAGFKDCTFIYDTQGMFPTVVAEKQKS